MTSRFYLPIVLLFFSVGTSDVAFAQSQQDVVRKQRKIIKEYSKALNDAGKATARDIRIAIRPGSKIFPQGVGDAENEARHDRLRLGDFGISFYNQGAGIVVEQIDPRSALADYGFREQDRVLAVGEHPIREERDFVKYLFAESRKSGRIGVRVLHDDDRVQDIFVDPSVLLEDVEPGFNNPLHRLGVTLSDRPGNDLRVADVVPQTPAQMAGVHRGDVIVGFDGERVKSSDDLAEVLSQAPRGTYVVRVQRDASQRELEVKLR